MLRGMIWMREWIRAGAEVGWVSGAVVDVHLRGRSDPETGGPSSAICRVHSGPGSGMYRSNIVRCSILSAKKSSQPSGVIMFSV